MKAWMGVVVVLATLAGGIVLMRPGKPASGPARGAVSAGAGSRVTDEKIAFISRGERVEIAEHLKDGRWTIVEFTADW